MGSELSQERFDREGVVDKGAFGEFEREAGRFESGAFERVRDGCNESPVRSWRLETLTAMSSWRSGQRCAQVAAVRQAWSRTQAPISTMSPVSSAVGMN